MTSDNGDEVQALGIETVRVESTVNGKTIELYLINVWYVFKFEKNVLSVLSAQDRHPRSKCILHTEIFYLQVERQTKLVGN